MSDSTDWYYFYQLSDSTGFCDCDWGGQMTLEDALAHAQELAAIFEDEGMSDTHEEAVVFVCQATEQNTDDPDWWLLDQIQPKSVKVLYGEIPSGWAI